MSTGTAAAHIQDNGKQSSMDIRVYNTLSRTKEPLETVEPGKVGIYLCGPTVYDRAHIGHMVGPVIFDTIKRYLEYCGFEVTWVVNITDVDDKLIRKAAERGISMAQVAEENTADYLENLAGMGVDQIDHMPKATEHIDEIIRFTEALVGKGYAYEVDGDVFFDVTRDAEYGKLTNRSVDSLQGEGGEAASRKRSAADFALWKRAKEGEPAWESPWGPGRPGWHIECSAMSRRLLGESFDIHGGGLDLVFPHHENEIAQSECCHGKAMARYWMHNGLLKRAAAGKVGGRSERESETATSPSLEEIQQATAEKIARSKGAGGLADQIRTFGGETIRFFLLRTHYRSTVLFSEDAVSEAAAGLETFYRYFERFERVTGEDFYGLPVATRRSASDEGTSADTPLVRAAAEHRESFLQRMDDDFNTGAAISELFELVRELNRFVDRQGLEERATDDPEFQSDRAALRRATVVLRELSRILGLFISADRRRPDEAAEDELTGPLMELLIELRAGARKRKDFATADRIRDQLAELQIVLEDRKGGTTWRREV